MVQSLTSGVSGLQQFQEKLNVIGNNIANSNTLGYKSGRADFEDTFSQSLSNGTSTIQVGSGVTTGTVRSLFNQGTIASTNSPSDMAIQGDGFFIVTDPISGKTFATRAGNFALDEQGYLTNAEGYRVQGYNDPGLGTIGDIQINATGNPDTTDTSILKKYSVDQNGVITVTTQNGKQSFTRGQILLQRFENPGALVKEGQNLFSGMADAGPLAQLSTPDSNGLGTISSGHLEMSNVDLSSEFAELITTQRGFQASARIITTTDEMLQEVVNLKR